MSCEPACFVSWAQKNSIVTKNILFYFLEKKKQEMPRDLPPMSASREDFLERCVPFLPEEVQKLIEEDKIEKKKMLSKMVDGSVDFINIFT